MARVKIYKSPTKGLEHPEGVASPAAAIAGVLELPRELHRQAVGDYGSSVANFGMVVFRSLGVPDILREENRLQAAAWKLAKRSSIPITVAEGRENAEVRADAENVVKAVIKLGEEGELDLHIGQFGVPPEDLVFMVTHRMDGPAADGDRASSLVKHLIRAIQEFVDEHPFVDSSGLPTG